MKIAGSDIQMLAQREAGTSRSVRESLRMWTGDRRPDFEGNGGARVDIADPVSLSATARAGKGLARVEGKLDKAFKPGPQDELRMQILIRVFEELTGEKIRLISPDELQFDEQTGSVEEIRVLAEQRVDGGAGRAGFGIEFDYHESHYEFERTSFSATGIIVTKDGREISFAVDISMTREFMQERNVSLRAGDAVVKDPLVINFAGDAADLTQDRFSFDLDVDGRPDQVSFVGPGSGFLALDGNGDGVINDGGELFGPRTGQGFGELAAHDSDGNLWIDEDDPVYDRLRIWTRDAQGNDLLMALGKAGVGAIYLGRLETPFSVKDGANVLMGQVASSGVYLREDGAAGTLQQIDLVV